MNYKDILELSKDKKTVIAKIIDREFGEENTGLESLSIGSNYLIDTSKGEFIKKERLPGVFDELIVTGAGFKDFLTLKEAICEASKEAYEKKEYSLVEFSSGENIKLQFFFEPILYPERLIIFGGGHISFPLVEMAKILGYYIVVVDDRLEFANYERFPRVDEVICKEFDAVFKKGYLKPGKNDNLVLLTRGHEFDELCLRQVIESKETFGYAGMIGSRRRVGKIINKLKEEYSQSEKKDGEKIKRLDNIFTPIGLDIGAQSPEEIAVSILAEIIAVGKGKLIKPENRPKIN